MSRKIEITADMKVQVLTFRGLKSEYYNGVPVAWAECFGMKNEENPDEPPFNRILYLRNVNIRPVKSDGFEAFLPIWHAAAITFKDEVPLAVLLISETALMDEFIDEHHPNKIIRMSYPKAKITEIRADLIDAEEEVLSDKVNSNFPCIIFKGWPVENWRANYLQMKAIVENKAKENGKEGQVDFTYGLTTSEISMQLHFVFLIVDMVHEEFLWIQRDEMQPIKS